MQSFHVCCSQNQDTRAVLPSVTTVFTGVSLCGVIDRITGHGGELGLLEVRLDQNGSLSSHGQSFW